MNNYHVSELPLDYELMLNLAQLAAFAAVILVLTICVTLEKLLKK